MPVPLEQLGLAPAVLGACFLVFLHHLLLAAGAAAAVAGCVLQWRGGVWPSGLCCYLDLAVVCWYNGENCCPLYSRSNVVRVGGVALWSSVDYWLWSALA